MTERVIEIKGLRKSYDNVEAVRGIDLSVDRGEVFALLGPNGAGKTTATEILEGYRPRDGGEVSVLGHDPARGDRELKRRIGIVLQSTGVDPFLTVRETIDQYGAFSPKPRRTEEVIQRSPSPATRSSCSWTNRPPGSTRALDATPGISCGTSRRSGRRSG
jgi:ABC-2 type transport system ATP-binding protein